MRAHFINIDILLKTESKAWIVSKDNPNIPILKIDPWEFKVFQSGIYRNQNNRIDFNGKVFWLPTEFMNKLKVSAKRNKADISNLGISMQEFLNKELIDNIPFNLNMDIFKPIINTDDDIYIICSKNTKNNYNKVVTKLEEELKELGLVVKNFYYTSDTFFDKDDDYTAYLKVKLLIQHLVGLKTDGDKFSSEEIKDYSHVIFYDSDKSSINLSKSINNVIEKLTIKTDDSTKLLVKEKIKSVENVLIVKEFTHNLTKKFNETIIPVEYSNIIKSFENFNVS
jgi:hypothetical protein